jgi:hypothetical protein
MFATALVASAAAFADGATALNAISFEGYAADATFTNGDAEKGEDGNDKSGNPFFYYDGDGDGSSVKLFATGDAGAVTAPARPYYFQGVSPAEKYLELSTEGGTLWRSINPISVTQGETTTYGLGAGQAIATDGTYLDTLVQFTPTEDGGAPELDGADKLAIWLNVDSNQQTNLMVKAAVIDIDQGAAPVATTFTITNKAVEAGHWYRLTVKAIPDIADGNGYPGFQIKLDGQLLMSDTCTMTSGSVDLIEGSDYEDAVKDGAVFASLGGRNVSPTLQGVGFKGSGALDDIVWTEENPFQAPAALTFTLTWPTSLTSVSYTLDGEAGSALTILDGTTTISGTNGAPVTLTGSIGYANKTVTGSITANGTLALGAVDISYYFPLTATADQDGTASHPYEIADETGLNAFKAATAAGFGKTLAYQLTADVALTEAWPGIGTYDNTTNADAFEGIFDGAGHRISNVLFADNETGGNAASTANNYRGFFNQVNGATIKNLTIQWNGWAPNVSTTEFGGAAFVGCANNATLECLTAEGTVTAGTHNNAGIAVRASGLTAPTTFSNCTNKMALTGNYTKLGGMCAITQAGTSTVTFDGCVNEGSITAVAVTGATNAGRDGVAGILGYAANGDGNTIINACVNTGTIDVSAGYSGTHSGYTGAKAGQLLGWANNSASLTGANMVGTGFVAVGAYSANKTSGQNFATVSGTTATMIADADVAPGQTQYMAMTEKAAYQFTAAGTLIVDEALKAATVTVADPTLLTLTSATSGTVTTYTAAGAGGDDYVVEIEGSDVVITPQEGDLEALAEAGVDTNSVAAVNAALATTIEGTSIPAWQALFLGVAPTTNGLETVAIKSISIAADGTVTVEMADGVTLKTGRGVDIKLKLMGSTDLTNWTQIGSDITNTKVIPAITPAQGETKKFYKVVVDFAGSSAQN